MVTASHNPPRDNGYKVYLGDGSQIVPPADAEIAARIAAVGPLADVPRGDTWRCSARTSSTPTSTPWPGWPATGPATCGWSTPRCTASAARRWLQVLETAGFDRAVRRGGAGAARPRLPDRLRSPTRRSPAPWTSRWRWPRARDVDLVVANDPDADRCAAAVPDVHGWRMLRGDEVGALLAHHLLTRGRTGTYACSIVSSSLLGKMAAAAGQQFAETLTGFKWISKVEGLVFGYEEALGYCVDPEHVKDKDGVSALLLLCELAAAEKARGPVAGRRPRRPGARARPARHRPALGAGHRPGRDRRGDGAAAGDAAGGARRAHGGVGRRPRPRASAGSRRPTACATG